MTMEQIRGQRGASNDPIGTRFASNQFYDQSILESTSFRVVPSLGSLVEGWLLLVPKRPALSLSQLSSEERAELALTKAALSARLGQLYGPLCEFEHGAAFEGSTTGCGVDQAHLHLVPLDQGDFIEAVRAESLEQNLVWEVATGIPEPKIMQDYLWFRAGSACLIAYPNSPVSQFFRRCVARAVGQSSAWNYREYPAYDVVKATTARLAA